MNANSSKHRTTALNEFTSAFESVLEEGQAFELDFEETPELSVLSDTLNTFKLITWQFQRSDQQFEYYGYLVHKNGSYYKLNDSFSILEDIEFTDLDHDEWLGGIYYNLVQMGDDYYVFSYRQVDEFTKFKSFDVLSFDREGAPILGGEKFVFPSDTSRDIVKNRVTFRYSVDAILSLNYNADMQMVVHDHLMQVIGQREGQGPTLVPDGTYEGYVFEEGKWIYKTKLFTHTYEEAPRPNQILGKSNKDVFGRERKNK